jgi:hypothetical protein
MSKNGKQITTILNKEQYDIFEQYKEKNNIESNFKAIRMMITNLPKFEQPDNSNLILSGNVSEDKKMLDDLPRSVLEKSIRVLDSKNRKEKNTIKRTGAFHNENFREDITSLLCGEVDLYEVKYHIDWWYYINQISTALSRKGVSSSLIKQYKDSDVVAKPKGKRRSVLLQNQVFH